MSDLLAKLDRLKREHTSDLCEPPPPDGCGCDCSADRDNALLAEVREEVAGLVAALAEERKGADAMAEVLSAKLTCPDYCGCDQRDALAAHRARRGAP